ncbi:unnamed protein product [Auanema sp. JU1783]|nr:unnamed protein product [Auanema sp. JU1783]
MSELGEQNEQKQYPPNHPMSNADPNFTYDGGTLCRDYWPDWLAQLATNNVYRINNTITEAYDFLTLDSVQYIFTICVRLRLPHDVRFVAALLFDKFMCLQTKSLWEFIACSDMPVRKKEVEWEKIETNLSRQIPLRIASCIQIASKSGNYHTSLSLRQVASSLRSLGHAYTKGAVLNSEIRILKTIGFAIPESPLIYPESLLKCLCSVPSIPSDLDYDSCWNHIVLFLDIVFLHHERLYTYLIQTLGSSRYTPQCSRYDHARLKGDWMLLGCGLVAASVACVHDDQLRDKVITTLNMMSGTPAEDILDMSTTLKKITLLLNEEKMTQKPQRTVSY